MGRKNIALYINKKVVLTYIINFVIYYHAIYYPKHAQNCISTMSTLLMSIAYYPNFNT